MVGDFEAIVRRYPTSGLRRRCALARGTARAGYLQEVWRRAREGRRSTPSPRARFRVSDKQVRRPGARGPRPGRPRCSPRPTRPSPPPAPTRPSPPSEPTRASAPAETPARLATIKDIRRTVLPDAVRVTIELDSEVAFHDERLEHPARVFVDLPATRASAGFVDRTIRFEGDADLVRQVRVGRHPNSTTRVVLDVAGISSYSVYPLYSPYRLVIDCIRATARAAGGRRALAPCASHAPVAPPVLPGRSLAPDSARALPTLAPAAGSTLRRRARPVTRRRSSTRSTLRPRRRSRRGHRRRISPADFPSRVNSASASRAS